MKAFICDHCGKREEPEKNYDMPRPGWYTVTSYKPPYQNLHTCSTICLVQLAQDRLIAEQPAEAPVSPDLRDLIEEPAPAPFGSPLAGHEEPEVH